LEAELRSLALANGQLGTLFTKQSLRVEQLEAAVAEGTRRADLAAARATVPGTRDASRVRCVCGFYVT